MTTRRDFLRRTTVGAAAVGVLGVPAFGAAQGAPTRTPVKLAFWTFENPQQRPWIHKRVKLYMEQNPHVTVDFQWFPFGDLGKKISVGFATGTAPEGFVSQDWFMPTWMDKGLLAPLDVQRLGYPTYDAFTDDFAAAFVKGATQDGKVYGYPLWFYGFCNYLNTKQFKEVGLDPDKDWPKDWKQFGEVAKRLTIKRRQQVHAPGLQVRHARGAVDHDPVQPDPDHPRRPVVRCQRQVHDQQRGRRQGHDRARLHRQAVRRRGPRRTRIATNPLPQMDWLKERCSMFWCHPIPLGGHQVAEREDAGGGLFPARAVSAASSPARASPPPTASTCVVNARAPKDKQEALQDLYKFIMSDLIDCWKDTAPFSLARKSGWADNPAVKEFPGRRRDHQGQGPGRVPAPHRRLHGARRRDAPRRAEDHAQQRRHQGDTRRGGGGGGPRARRPTRRDSAGCAQLRGHVAQSRQGRSFSEQPAW